MRDKEHRASYLAEACSDDEALRREVELLLAASQKAGAKDLSGQLTASSLGVIPGQAMAHYRILSRIGGGGMGEVFLAKDCTTLNSPYCSCFTAHCPAQRLAAGSEGS